jgi:hypothetical protein
MAADKDLITIRGVDQVKEEVCLILDNEAPDHDVNASSI